MEEEEEAVEPMEAAAEAAATTAAESAATTSAEAATATEAEGGEPPQTRCGICFDDEPEPPAVLASLRCGHAFCTACWGSLLRVALEKGGAGLRANCPHPSCAEPIPGDAWAAWLPPDQVVMPLPSLWVAASTPPCGCSCPLPPSLPPHAADARGCRPTRSRGCAS